MAKSKPSVKGLFDKTASPATASKAKDIIKARGVGLKESEWAEIESIAAAMGQTMHYVSAELLRAGLEQYRTGKLKPKTKQTKTF